VGFICDQAPPGSILDELSDGDGPLDLDGILATIYATLHDGQKAFVDDQSTEILGCSAGYGAGKTRALCAKALHLAAANQGCTGVVMEPTGPLIRDIWQQDFDDFLEAYGIRFSFRASPLPEYVLHLPQGDTKILCRSFENWQRIIGVNAAFILCDEIDTVNPAIADKAFPKILGRLRAGNVRQFAAASTPEGFRWMWRTFASEDGLGRADRRLIRMKTSDNPHLPPDFEARMRANYDPKLLKAYLEGEFINLTSGQVYDRFRRDVNVREFPEPEHDEKLLLGVDFNIGNCNAVVCLMRVDPPSPEDRQRMIRQPGYVPKRTKRLWAWDELTGQHDTDALGQEVVRRYPSHTIHGYPDASGTKRTTNSTRSDTAILQSYGISNHSPQANPPVRDRVNSVQALLENGEGEVRLFVHPRCKRLIECLEQQAYAENGEPDKTGGFDHLNDAMGYVCHRLFAVGKPIAGPVRSVRLY
jgi:hypothetical protein